MRRQSKRMFAPASLEVPPPALTPHSMVTSSSPCFSTGYSNQAWETTPVRTNPLDRAKQIEHAIDSEENEKKKKKQILTKNIEVKKLKSTRHNLPGSGILQSQKSGDTQLDGYEMRSKIVSEEMRSKKTVKGSVTIRSQVTVDT
uniref:Uncharacterized protein n=1 Tax=Oryza sativa subsp. japonica TaxID=39947 RepID=Q69PA7_ORYSJ|nr:hypothetical protein [Oryza sativa Japonica Group]